MSPLPRNQRVQNVNNVNSGIYKARTAYTMNIYNIEDQQYTGNINAITI